MEKILPIIMPPSETYHNSSFTMGIVLANDNIKNAFYNYYHNIECSKTNYMNQINLHFEDFDWEPFRKDGLAETNCFHVKNIAKECFVGFIKERIDQDNYILLYMIDEYYLSYTTSYGIQHYIHDTYIYGYRDDKFCVMAYSKRKLQLLEIDANEVVEALYCQMTDEPDTKFSTFRIASSYVSINIDKIKKGIQDFLEKGVDETNAYGIQTYKVIKECTKAKVEGRKEEDESLDLRIFRLIWEHKKIFLLHFEKLNELQGDKFKPIVEKMEEIEHIARLLFMLALKFTVTKKTDILTRLIDILTKLEIKEKACYGEAIQLL
ncbi:MAG: hypothetical protein K2N44_18645 [Lachnospiraceae bacterium]|nr:hypothetical protein [Lachnospiraceae bacterium]